VRNLAFGYDPEKPLFTGLSLTISAGDRICIVGKNGKGKTTLLRLLSAKLNPLQGEVTYNPGIVSGLFEQTNIKSLDDSKTVAEEILYTHPDVDQQTARNLCGAMMFEGNDALKKISVLSGGEKSRVMLGKLLATPVNLLLLDEPTNHLDMDSCDALLAAIDSFEGAVVMVTHNEMFLHALAEKLVVFQKEGASLFEGTYQSFLEKRGWYDETETRKPSTVKNKEIFQTDKLSKKEIRQRRSQIITKRAKITGPIEKQIEAIEDKIEILETDMDKYNESMQDASQAGDGEKIVALSKSIHRCQSSIDQLFDKLEDLTEKILKEKTLFDKELEALEQAET
jgi:ATP-binding cassette subfamily F protein 3